MISTISATQVYTAVNPVILKHMTQLFIYRLSKYADLHAIIEEMGAVYDPKTRLQIYHEAIDEPYSFLHINLMQKYRSKMFMTQFSHYLNPS